MKSFKELSRTKKVLTIATGLLAGCFLFFDDQENEFAEEGGYPLTEQAAYPMNSASVAPTANAMNSYTTNQSSPTTSGGGEKVEIYDQGLQMPISTIVVPDGWKVIQDIATDPNTGNPIKSKLEISGPHKESSRLFGKPFMYHPVNGKTFQQVYQEALSEVMRGQLEQLSVGELQRDTRTERTPYFQKMAQKAQHLYNSTVTAHEVQVTGQKNGQPYRGTISFYHMIRRNQMGSGGLTNVTLFLSPTEHFDTAVALVKAMGDNIVMNPAYEQRMAQMAQRRNAQHRQTMANIDAANRRGTAAHQQRMANQRASFNAHQQNMAQMSQAQDASFNSYMNNARNSNSSAWSNDSYNGQNAIVDQIHERSTFENPDTGHDISLDGQYDHNYTNGMGDYYRTNDASFDPNSMQGDWQQVDPRSPNY